ncbi:MAG: serine hydrolase [Gemmatimonadales bacterium]|nr:MAG: serine hydrolase [Gemmatimonadales bacterium]
MRGWTGQGFTRRPGAVGWGFPMGVLFMMGVLLGCGRDDVEGSQERAMVEDASAVEEGQDLERGQAAERGGSDWVLLRERLTRRLAEEGDSIHIGIAVLDMETGRSLEMNAERVFHAASTMKVPVLLEWYRQSELGIRSLDEGVRVHNRFRSVYDGSEFVLDEDVDEGLIDALGQELPARRIAEGMIQVSSNLGTNILLELLTADSVQATMARIGAPEMQVLRGVSDIPAFEAGLSNRTTARAYLRVLEAIARCEVTSQASCDEMMEILEGQEFRSEIPAGIPDSALEAGTRVGNKTGSITRILHDGAIVQPTGRAPYLVVTLSEGYEDKDHGSRTLSDLSGIIWDTLMEEEPNP